VSWALGFRTGVRSQKLRLRAKRDETPVSTGDDAGNEARVVTGTETDGEHQDVGRVEFQKAHESVTQRGLGGRNQTNGTADERRCTPIWSRSEGGSRLSVKRHSSSVAENLAAGEQSEKARLSSRKRGCYIVVAEKAREGERGADAAERARFDLRWKVALGFGVEEQLDAKSTLQASRPGF